MNDDPKLSQRYRELPREEPPRALDDAILAASRRAVQRRRWYVPLAAAAVITLAVAVTLHVQHDRPGEEVDAVSPAMKVQEAPKAEAPRQRQAPARELSRDTSGGTGFTPDPAEERSRADVQSAPQPSSPAPAAAPAEAPRVAGARSEASRMSAQIESPQQMLERVARLREAGRHEEADRTLAKFRKRYPDYRLSDEMKAKVEKRQ